jgi:hypothetical protein
VAEMVERRNKAPMEIFMVNLSGVVVLLLFIINKTTQQNVVIR